MNNKIMCQQLKKVNKMNQLKIGVALVLVTLLASTVLIVPVSATSTSSGGITAAWTANDAISIYSVTGTATVNPTPGGVTNDVLTVKVIDSAGWTAVNNVTAQNTHSSVNYGSPIVSTSGSMGSNSSTAVFYVTVPFQYYYPPGSYVINVVANDAAAGAPATSTYSVTYNSALGIVINSGTNLNFGSLNLSQTSAVQTTSIANSANTPLNITASAANFTSTNYPTAANIPVTSLTVNMGTQQTVTNSGSAITGNLAIGDTVAPTPQNVNFQLTVPASVTGYSGAYSTTVTLTGSS
jgi:hypothetical protein